MCILKAGPSMGPKPVTGKRDNVYVEISTLRESEMCFSYLFPMQRKNENAGLPPKVP